ncbi:MAG: DMT family transporter [Ardenticatenaceae bacterium]
MTNFGSLVIMAIICGMAITLQGNFMGLMDKQMGTLESIFITYGSGGLVIALVMLVRGGANLGRWQSVPWYALTAGVCGLLIVGTIGYIIPRLGAVTGFTIIVAAQFMLAALLDHFGLLGAEVRPLNLARLLGLGMLLLGTWLIVR